MTTGWTLDDVGTRGPMSPTIAGACHSLWEAGDGHGTPIGPLTCGDAGSSTIHRTYYWCC
jgi:hypothetical protein